MCGIAGFVGDLGGSDRQAAAAAMTGALVHRGPDGEGIHLDQAVALGHRRLAIIDLHEGAAQPMTGPSGAVIVFNGEIYNYVELRKGLEAAGETFATESDTEVLLRLYEREGAAALQKLVGMFAFAVWEPDRRRLFLARDRLGKKPLYYFHDGRRFAFASEIKALLALPEVADGLAMDPLALSDFLSLGYIQTPKTAFATIRRLPAACQAVFDADHGSLSVGTYWHLEEHFLADRLPAGPATREAFADCLSEAVRLRLRSDVPVGVFLSGGLDSSAVAALMARLDPQGTRAFCVGFAEDSYDESHYARLVADHLGIPIAVLPHALPDADLIRRLVWHCDEPFADTSMMPTYLLNRSARDHVTVALTGDGADEILAGYPTYRADALYALTGRIPAPVTRGLSRLADRLLRPRYKKLGWDFKLRQYLRGHGLSPERAHYAWREILSGPEKAAILGPDLAKACAGYDPFDTFAGWFAKVKGAGFLDRSLFVDSKTWLQDDILVKADRMSMAASLEVRSPFLDHRVVEFAARLPANAKMAGGTQKVLLKEIMAELLPAATIRRRKAGFNAPTRALGCTALEPGDFTAEFPPGFRLDPRREDITFKSFSLATLGTWLQLLSSHRHSGRWEP